MRKSILLFVLFTLTNIPLLLFAQGGYQVTGHIISSEDNEPMIGVSIAEKGTSNGVITDVNGNYSIKVTKSPATLQFSYIGMKTIEKQVTASTRLDLKMESDAQQVDEVVVVAYGVRKKGTITGSMAVVKADQLENVPAPSFDQALQGKTPGLQVISSSGEPSASADFQIRGVNSINAGTTPLFILDGIAITADVFSAINPNDIESVSVLKDASSTSIYGARGANGVVIITTKKGKVGKPQIKYEGSFGVQHVIKTIGMMDAYEFVKLQAEIDPTDVRKTYLKEYEGKQWTLEDYRDIEQIDWQDDILRTAWRQSHNVSLMGGTEGVRYNASASYFDQDGIILNSNYKRFQTRMNTVVRRGKLNMSVTANYSRSIQTGNSTSLYSSSGMNNLFYSVWGSRPVTYPGIPLSTLTDNALDESVSPTNDYRHNPVLSLKNEYRKGYTNNLQLNGFVEYEFMKGLKLKVSGGYTYDARSNDSFNNSQTRYGGPTSNDNRCILL